MGGINRRRKRESGGGGCSSSGSSSSSSGETSQIVSGILQILAFLTPSFSFPAVYTAPPLPLPFHPPPSPPPLPAPPMSSLSLDTQIAALQSRLVELQKARRAEQVDSDKRISEAQSRNTNVSAQLQTRLERCESALLSLLMEVKAWVQETDAATEAKMRDSLRRADVVVIANMFAPLALALQHIVTRCVVQAPYVREAASGGQRLRRGITRAFFGRSPS